MHLGATFICLVAVVTVVWSFPTPPANQLKEYVDKVHQAWIDTYIAQHPDNPHRIKVELKNAKGDVKWVNEGQSLPGYTPTGKEIDLVKMRGSDLPDQFRVPMEKWGDLLYMFMKQPVREAYANLVHERWMRANAWEKDMHPELFVDYELLTEPEKDKDRYFVDYAEDIFK
ncbi:hypothetical protein FOL47_002365 [Perkinsus chesapeaki]|uniref:Uncharacterized protein n=1 Tax=Perkinsus chesapeaki TaxID=330153 RepID=A0A7J6MDU9_PERCH|nr:hypothetical protein FOL47_002365 [Perkinsus chesapeaki]